MTPVGALAASELISLFLGSIDINVNIDSSSLGTCSRVDMFLSNFITSKAAKSFSNSYSTLVSDFALPSISLLPKSARLSTCAQI